MPTKPAKPVIPDDGASQASSIDISPDSLDDDASRVVSSSLTSDSPAQTAAANELAPTSPTVPIFTPADASQQLPNFRPQHEPTFCWGAVDGPSFVHSVTCAYDEAVHWRRNMFTLPSGLVGKEFVAELSRLFRAYAESSALECIALKAAALMPLLLLQRPHAKSKAKELVSCLQRRLHAWKAGDIDGLVREARVLQRSLPPMKRHCDANHTARVFSRLMLQGKVKAALRWISGCTSQGVLSLEEVTDSDGHTVLDVLLDKHPPAVDAHPEAIMDLGSAPQPYPTHPVLFERLDGDMIRSCALRTEGSAGPSGVDASGWRRLCTSFHAASRDLCNSVAAFARRLSTQFVDPSSLASFTACRLIPLDKAPGVRPIGVCETVRRIIGKAVMCVVGWDVQNAAGSLQLCAGQTAGCEAAVHAMRKIFEDSSTDGVLLVDASNAFNRLNRRVALLNIRIVCPSIATVLINTYRADAQLFVGGRSLLSREGTTQGDPLAMAMYALAMVPLQRSIRTEGSLHVWFADDATAGGRLRALRHWWDALVLLGPRFGYYPNSAKTWLVVKDEAFSEAQALFEGTGIRITQEGRRHLGAAIGSPTFTEQYVCVKVTEWVQEVDRLSTIALSQPHAAYAGLTHGLAGRWTYLARTVPGAGGWFRPLEDAVRLRLLPALLGRAAPSDIEWDLLTLPVRLGGMGIPSPTRQAIRDREASERISAPLTALIVSQTSSLGAAPAAQLKLRSEEHQQRRAADTRRAHAMSDRLNENQRRLMEIAREPGASAWLSALPIEEHGFALHKAAFRDAVHLRYGWQLPNVPSSCVCGQSFSVTHALQCPTGGFPSVRHNAVRDLLADVMTCVCHDVATEPVLQPLSGEEFDRASTITAPCARLDIAASGFYGGRFERTLFDVRVFNPLAQSNRLSLAACYRRHEAEKRRMYGARVREVERASFVPFVMTCVGGFGPAATATTKRLAALVAEKEDQCYSAVITWLRTRISFGLLRSAVMCLRGARSSRHQPQCDWSALDLHMAESRVR